ncbi:MAG TPA: pyridoxamine 5'-phosphate oxidase family protein [Bacteroidales bacterium]|nr:pyridoxamine 5'-phosphate oxidase family protein [Bacteroidales bacterium]
MDKRIVDFIKRHHVLTIATTVNNEPWCANCFYAYAEDENMFVFTTDDDTRHGEEFEKNSMVAGSVVLETKIVGKIQGIQFQGEVSRPDDDLYEKVKKAYLKRFPIAVLMDTSLWVVRLTHVKLTDNRLGFGKKLVWEKEKKW